MVSIALMLLNTWRGADALRHGRGQHSMPRAAASSSLLAAFNEQNNMHEYYSWDR